MNVLRMLHTTKWTWQRARRGWADCDTWDFDVYLTSVMAGALDYMAAHSVGHPAYLNDQETWDFELRRAVRWFRFLRDHDNIVPPSWWKEDTEAWVTHYQGVHALAMNWLAYHWNDLWD